MLILDTNLKYGYGGGWFNPEQKTAETPMVCAFERAERVPLNFRDECVRTARLISRQAQDLGRIPVVLLSGGLDSEVVIKAFLEADVDFRAITFRYPDGLNAHELHFIDLFMQENQFEHEFYDIDIERWIESSEAAELFTGSHAWHFEMVPHMKLMQEVQARAGVPVLGNGEALYLKTGPKEWSYVEYEYDLAWYRFARKFRVSGAMGFFQHTPEQTLSMMSENKMQLLAAGRNRTANVLLPHSRQIKYGVYFEHWPELVKRTRKFDGGERFRPVLRALNEKYRELYPVKYDEIWTTPISSLLEALHPLNSIVKAKIEVLGTEGQDHPVLI